MHEPFIGMKICLDEVEEPKACDLDNLPIAMTYTPIQQWKTTYCPEEALMAGTVFPELNLPFKGGCCKGGCKR